MTFNGMTITVHDEDGDLTFALTTGECMNGTWHGYYATIMGQGAPETQVSEVANDQQDVLRLAFNQLLKALSFGELNIHPHMPEHDDDPVCVCGTHRSEHALCGCPEGFQTPEAWDAERQGIISQSDDEAYGDDQP